MKIEAMVQRALSDEKYANRLRKLGREALEEGMESRAFATLIREVAETTADKNFMKTPFGFVTMIRYTNSNLSGPTAAACPVLTAIGSGGSTGIPSPLSWPQAADIAPKRATRSAGIAKKARPATRKTT